MEQEYTARLESWMVQTFTFSKEFIIWGYVYDDIKNRFTDGQRIHTSGVNNLHWPEEGAIITTKNSTYLLGKKLAMPTMRSYGDFDDKYRGLSK